MSIICTRYIMLIKVECKNTSKKIIPVLMFSIPRLCDIDNFSFRLSNSFTLNLYWHFAEILSTFIKKLKQLIVFSSNPPEVFLGKGVLKLCSKFTGDHLCWSMISIKFLGTSVWVFPDNWQHIFRSPLYKSTYGELLLWFLETTWNWFR